MRRLALSVVVVANVVFSVACLVGPACGCGEEGPGPTPTAAGGPCVGLAVASSTAEADSGADACDDGPPRLELLAPGTAEPLPVDVYVANGVDVTCSTEEGLEVDLALAGLRPGALELVWTLTVDGQVTEGGSTVDVGCGPEGGLETLILSAGFPIGADGAPVQLDVAATDADGTVASASTVFVVHVE